MGSTESTLPAMEDDTTSTAARSTTDRRRRSELRETVTDSAGASDDPWWWEVENENLILDQVPIAGARGVYRGGESAPQRSESAAERAGRRVTVSGKRDDSSDSVDQTDYQVIDGSEVAPMEKVRPQSLDEFKEELRMKRLARQSAVQDLRDEIATLRSQLATEQALTRRLRKVGPPGDGDADTGDAYIIAETAAAAAVASIVDDADDVDPMSRGRHANIELANAQLALQLANSENLSLRTELGVVQKQVGTLKEVIACCKQMLAVKEEQCTQLKSKLDEIETSFNEHEMKVMSANLRQEYERQLGNIRQLRQLYDERQRVAAAEHENLQRLLSIKKDELSAEQDKTKSLEERNQTLMKEVENANTELATVREECNEHKFEKRALKEEMGTINTLFSQMVMGFNGKNNLDIDRLTTMLEENRTLLNDMATKEASCSDGATLPKLLFELVEQASIVGGGNKDSRCSTSPSTSTLTELDPTAATAAASDDDDDDAHAVDEDAAAVKEAVNVSANNATDGAATVEELDASEAEQESTADALTTDTTAATTSAAPTSTVTSTMTTMATMKIAKKHHRRNASAKSCGASAAAAPLSLSMAALRCHEPEVIGKVATAQEIIGNLPKVWKVLMELLSHHQIERVQFEENGQGEECYKSVETAAGPKSELSVSKTYIKLKDLILEKKSLVKETNRLKTLNSHLEYRLNEQEKRLSAVSLELTKTWHMVGKMQRQHRQLHTQEQILRYQLQQKRRLLGELKDELEYCRRKWAAARAKNDESQEQCNDLRREFARRKLEDANHSAESGYSDSGPPSDEDAASAATSSAATDAVAEGLVVVGGGGVGGGSNCRRKQHLKELFEHTRKIKRMQSTSPGRAACAGAAGGEEIVLRWNSAPPTCGWRHADRDDDSTPASSTGAIPKRGAHSSRSMKRSGDAEIAAGGGSSEKEDEEESAGRGDDDDDGSDGPRSERTERIQRLEEQCKSLIQQVLETSDNRERLEVQLCRFQDAIAPVQYAVPLDEFIGKTRVERMTRASSAPATGILTPREEEYTRKRSERLERLEEESRQLMSRIKRTSDRGHYLRCSLDRIRRAPSREGSFESNTEEEAVAAPKAANENGTEVAASCSADEPPTYEERIARYEARLQHSEKRSLSLKPAGSNDHRAALGSKLDTLHERHDGDISPSVEAPSTEASSAEAASVETSSAERPSAETSSAERPSANSAKESIEQRIENIKKISTNRDERLRILEEGGKELLTRLSHSSERGTLLINRIAERELSRQARASATPSREQAAAAAADLLPTPKNVACTCIVDEELTDCVTVTTTASQIAKEQQSGAIPKSKPVAQLSAARARGAPIAPPTQRSGADSESLEDMVKRLQALPFPSKAAESPPKETPVEQDAVADEGADEGEDKGADEGADEGANKPPNDE